MHILRSRRFPFCSIGLALVLAALCATPRGPADAASRAKPNVVILLADDLGYGELGAYGVLDIPTPNIDALARGGVRFTDGYVADGICAPSRAGLLTGRYPQKFGFYGNEPPPGDPRLARYGLPQGQKTLANALKGEGYATGIVGKWHLGFTADRFPLKRGFDEFFGFLDSEHPYFGADLENPDNPIYRANAKITEPQYLTRAFAREAVDFIRRHADRPFFLYVPFNSVHLPLQAEPAMLARFASIADVKRRHFAAMLTHLDEAVGAILQQIRAEGLEQDTLVAFLGDNGCITSKSTCRNTPLRGGKFTLYEGGIRVPFLLSWPGTIPAQRVYANHVSALDLFPTAVAAAKGLPYANAGLDGVNLLPFVTGSTAGAPHSYLYWGTRAKGAVRKGDWKLLDLPPSPVQLYNLRTDRSERTNVAGSKAAIVAELRAARAAWASKLQPPLW